MPDVRMPDGTIIKNVPEGTTQEDLLERFSLYKVKTAKTKYELPAEESYSPEGIPLYQPSYQADMPAGVKKAERVLTDIAGAPVRAAMSIAKPVVGAMEFAGAKAPSQAVSMIDEGLKQQTGPISTGASFMGDIAAGFGGAGAAQKALQYTPKLGAAISQLNPYAKTALGGAGFGLTMPTGKTIGDEGFFSEKAQEAGLGAGLGLALHGVLSGASHLLAPALERLKQLKAQGVNVDEFVKNATPGQILGGGTNLFERFLEAAPFGGMKGWRRKGEESLRDLERQRLNEMKAELDVNKSAIDTQASSLKSKVARTKEAKDLAFQEQKLRQNKALREQKDIDLEGLSADTVAEKQALADRHAAEVSALEKQHGEFSTPIIAKVLQPIEGLNIVKDARLPPEARGHEAIKYAQKKVSEAYDNAVKDLGTVRTDPQVNIRITQILDEANDPITGLVDPNVIKKLDATVTHLKETMENMEGISGAKWHEVFKKLGKQAYDLSSKDPTASGYYRNLQKAWGDLAAASDTTGRIRTINDAFRILQPVEVAAVKPGAAAAAGEFGPKELLSAAISEAPSTNVAARGEAVLQSDAQKALARMEAERKALEAKHAAEKKAFEDQQSTIKAQKAARATAVKSQYEDQKIANQLAEAQERNRLNALAEDRKARIEAARKAQENRLSAKHDVQKEGLKETVEKVITKPTSGLETGVYRTAMVYPIAHKVGRSLLDPSIDVIPSAINYAIGEGFAPVAFSLASPVMSRLYGHLAAPVIKAGAMAERPSIVRKAGENIRDYLKSGAAAPTVPAIPGYKAYQEAKREREEEEYAQGGLAQYAKGGHATPAWQRKEGQNPEGGLNAAGRASYHAETGGTLKRPQPEGGKRRDSFCARMKGAKEKLTSAETARDPDSRINKALRKWNC